MRPRIQTFPLSLLLALAGCAAAVPPPIATPVNTPEIGVGSSWTYDELNGYNGELIRTFRSVVTEAGPDSLVLKDTRPAETAGPVQTFTREWNLRRKTTEESKGIDYTPPYPAYVFPLEVGKTWKIESAMIDRASSRKITMKVYGKVIGWERVKVPAGEFDALKIRRDVYMDDREWWRDGTRVREFDWYAPEVKRFVKHEDYSEYRDRTRSRFSIVRGDWNRIELVSYQIEPINEKSPAKN